MYSNRMWGEASADQGTRPQTVDGQASERIP